MCVWLGWGCGQVRTGDPRLGGHRGGRGDLLPVPGELGTSLRHPAVRTEAAVVLSELSHREGAARANLKVLRFFS